MKDIARGGNTRSVPSSEADVRAGCQKVTYHVGPPDVPTGCTTRRNTPCSYPAPLRSSDSSTALRHNCHTVPNHTDITIVLYGASLFMMGTTYPRVQSTLSALISTACPMSSVQLSSPPRVLPPLDLCTLVNATLDCMGNRDQPMVNPPSRLSPTPPPHPIGTPGLFHLGVASSSPALDPDRRPPCFQPRLVQVTPGRR